MKLKVIFLTKIIVFCMICTSIAGVGVNVQVREAFERRVLDVYGTENYLGPMISSVHLITDKEIEEWNPEDTFSYYATDPAKNHNSYDIQISGRFSSEKISDIYKARETVYSLAEYLGIKYDKNTFLYGKKRDGNGIESDDTYIFYQYYDGVRVDGGVVYLDVDKSGNTTGAYFQTYPHESFKIDTTIPAFTKEQVLDLMQKEYRGYEMEECRLCLMLNYKEYVNYDKITWDLRWEVDVHSEESLVYCIVFDAFTGEEADVYFACDA